jgi:Rieske Fe-S protein
MRHESSFGRLPAQLKWYSGAENSREECPDCDGKKRVLDANGSAVASQDQARWLSKEEARSGLRRLQRFIGIIFLLSAFAGTYLLITDGSLWLLAISHAVGLVAIALIDTALGILNLLSVKRAYLPSLAAAFLGFFLQLGDILTAPQYNMTIQYFASYLFGLLAFDLLLILQVSVISVGVFGRGYARHLARRKTRRGRELSYSRRGFIKSIVGFAGLVGFSVALGSIKLPAPSLPPAPVSSTTQFSQSAQAGQPSAAITNTSSLKVGSPVYFEYPSGYPNVLLKRRDGSMVALSMLCTHVCCQCVYDGSANEIYCPCHGSVFDANGNVLRGPANFPLPKIELNIDSQGNIFPVKVNGSSPCLPA